MSFRVLVADPKHDDEALFLAAGRNLNYDLRIIDAITDIPEDLMRNCDAFCMFSVKPVEEDMIDRMDRCKLLVRAGVGFDNVNLAACATRGIPVANVPDYGINEVADHALALMVTFTRGIRLYANHMQKGIEHGWNWQLSDQNRRTYRRRVGIVGLGRIGTAFARRCHGLGMDVWTYDPHLPSGAELAMHVTRTQTLHELLANCDILSLHVPLSEETHHLIDAKAIAAMQPGTILINTSRGPVVDLDALYEGMKNGPIQCAGLDVFEIEPAPSDHPLIKAWTAREEWIDDRLALTPHAAFNSPDAVIDMRTRAIHLIADYLEGKPLRNCVNGHLLAENDRR